MYKKSYIYICAYVYLARYHELKYVYEPVVSCIPRFPAVFPQLWLLFSVSKTTVGRPALRALLKKVAVGISNPVRHFVF